MYNSEWNSMCSTRYVRYNYITYTQSSEQRTKACPKQISASSKRSPSSVQSNSVHARFKAQAAAGGTHSANAPLTAPLSTLNTSRWRTVSSGIASAPVASLKMCAKSACATSGRRLFFLPSRRALKWRAKSLETTSARSTTLSGTPARFATWVPNEELATPSTSLYRKTSCGEVWR